MVERQPVWRILLFPRGTCGPALNCTLNLRVTVPDDIESAPTDDFADGNRRRETQGEGFEEKADQLSNVQSDMNHEKMRSESSESPRNLPPRRLTVSRETRMRLPAVIPGTGTVRTSEAATDPGGLVVLGKTAKSLRDPDP